MYAKNNPQTSSETESLTGRIGSDSSGTPEQGFPQCSRWINFSYSRRNRGYSVLKLESCHKAVLSSFWCSAPETIMYLCSLPFCSGKNLFSLARVR